MSCWDSRSFAHSEETHDHTTYVVMRGVAPNSVTSLDPKCWWYLIRGIGSLWGHSWWSLATGIAVWSHSQIFSVLPTSGTYNYSTVRCIIYHHSALHQLFYYIPYQRATINQHYLLFKSCVWSLEHQFLSVLHEHEPISLMDQPLGHHRRTWLRPSHSGYNSIVSYVALKLISFEGKVAVLWGATPCNLADAMALAAAYSVTAMTKGPIRRRWFEN